MFSKIKDMDNKIYNNDKRPVPPSVLSMDINIKGDIISDGEIHVDGHIEGDIRCRTLIIGTNAEIIGSVQADFTKIYGSLNGQLYARSVFLAGTARVTGDITHESLEMESGAFLEGHCRHMNDPIPAEQAPADLMITDGTSDKKESENQKK